MNKKRNKPKSKSKSKSRKPSASQEQEEDVWWSIKAILDERKTKGQIEYLVDWEPDRLTGETFAPSWEPSDNVTFEAEKEWKLGKQAAAAGPAASVPDSSAETPTPVASGALEFAPTSPDIDESQPPRPSNWRQIERTNSDQSRRRSLAHEEDSDEPPRKRPRIEYSEALTEEPAPSITSTESLSTALETPAAFDQEDPIPPQGLPITVAIYKDPSFDPSGYLSVTNTQSTGHSTQSLSELEEEDRRIAISSQLSEKTIPDSQENSGQHWTQHTTQDSAARDLDPRRGEDSHHQSQAQKSAQQTCSDSNAQGKHRDEHTHSEDIIKQGNGDLTQDSPHNSQIDPKHLGTITEHAQQSGPGSGQEASVPDEPTHLSETEESPRNSRSQDREPASPSTSKETDIPSHQPATTLSQIGSSIQASNNSPSIGSTDTPQAHGHTRNIPASSYTEPGFLTQPHPTSVQVAAGSWPSSETAPSNSTIVQTSSSEQVQNSLPTELHRAPSPRLSQDAQIVHRDTFISTEAAVNDTTSSVETNSYPTSHPESQEASDAAEREEPTRQGLPDTEPISGVSDTRVSEPSRVRTEAAPSRTQEGQRNPPRELRTSQIMNESQSESPSRRTSAVDRLKDICSFDDLVAGLDGPALGSGDQLDGDRARMEDPVSRAQTQGLEATVHSALPLVPDLHAHSEPPFQVDPWAGSIAPSSIMPQPSSGLVQEISGVSHVVPMGSVTELMLPEHHRATQQTTIAPADITRQVFDEPAIAPALTQEGVIVPTFDSSEQSIAMAHFSNPHIVEEPYDVSTPREYLVTLPFQARARPLYDATILEFREEIQRFGGFFTGDTAMEPDPSLVARIDELFNRLRNVCDYPQDLIGTPLESLSAVQKAKYCYDANSKFNFVFELLQGLSKETKVLLIARSVSLLRLLFSVAEALDIECTCDAVPQLNRKAPNSVVTLTLALDSEAIDPTGYQVVVGFDHSFKTSVVKKRLHSDHSREYPWLIMSLVTTHSIDHIDLHIRDETHALARRNALLSSIVNARNYISDPERGYLEPHDLAKEFYGYVNGEVDSIFCIPISVPDDVLDIYDSSQPQPPGGDEEPGRKRKLDEEDDDNAKRVRTALVGQSSLDEPILNDQVRQMLKSVTLIDGGSTSEEDQVSVPLAILEALAEKHAGYEHRLADAATEPDYKSLISNLQAQVKEYEKTARGIYKRYREALQDRTKFEREREAANSALEATRTSARTESDNLRTRVAELEATVANLRAAFAGEEGAESPLATAEKLVEESKETVRLLEKRLENARNNEEYISAQYQIATSSVTSMRAEITELKEQNVHLQNQASDNLVKIHQIQAETTSKQFSAQIRDLKSLVKEREIELDRAREELRQIKLSRRETRGASVQGSPRMSMMSPRPGRGPGGSGSRGTSPAPSSGLEGLPGILSLTQQVGNGRFNHLRE